MSRNPNMKAAYVRAFRVPHNAPGMSKKQIAADAGLSLAYASRLLNDDLECRPRGAHVAGWSGMVPLYAPGEGADVPCPNEPMTVAERVRAYRLRHDAPRRHALRGDDDDGIQWERQPAPLRPPPQHYLVTFLFGIGEGRA
jgi:hypothetical protein